MNCEQNYYFILRQAPDERAKEKNISCGTSNVTPNEKAAQEFFTEYVEGAKAMTADECNKLMIENSLCEKNAYAACEFLTGENTFSKAPSTILVDKFDCSEEFKEMLGTARSDWDGKRYQGNALFNARIKWLYENAAV